MESALKFASILASLLSMSSVAAPALAQGAPDGGALFKQRCQMCHSVESGKPGLLAPNLADVFGRKAAATAFTYSPALRASGLTWDKGTLDAFLAAPMKLVPGTRMVIAVPDPRQRAAIIGYLASTKR